MAQDNIIGMAMQLDVSNIKAGLDLVSKEISKSQTEFKKATAGMDNWQKSSEGLTAKLSSLNTNLGLQAKAINGLQADIERLSNLEGDHTEEIARQQKKLDGWTIKLETTKKAIRNTEKALEEFNSKEQDSNTATAQLTKKIDDQKQKLDGLKKSYSDAVLSLGKNSKEARNLGKEINSLNRELNKNQKEMDESEKASAELGKSLIDMKKVGESTSKAFAKIGTSIAGAFAGFLATAEATRAFRTNMGKVEVAFSESGLSAEQAKDTYEKFYGVLADEGKATEAVSHLAKLSKNQKDLSKWTNIATGVYASFGDSLPIENLMEASNETAKTGKIVGGLADALNWAGASEEDFQSQLDSLSTEQERNALIASTLNGLYSEASAKYKETNKDIIASNEAQARLSGTMSEIGKKAEPLATSFKMLGAQILENLMPLVDEWIPKIQNNLPQVVGLIGTLVGAFVTLKAAMLAYNTVQKLVNTYQAIQNGLMLANPAMIQAVLIVGAIALITGAVMLLWKKSETFRDVVIGVWEACKNACKVAFDFILKAGTSALDGIENAWDKATTFFSNVWKGIKDVFNNVTSFFKDIFTSAVGGIKASFNTLTSWFDGIWQGIKNVFNDVTSWFKGIFDGGKEGIINSFKDMPGKMLDVGKDIVKGLWNGIDDMTGWVIGKIEGFGDSVLGGIKKFFGIHSPSTVMRDEVGVYLAEGVAEGISDGESAVTEAGAELGHEVLDSVFSGVQEEKKGFLETVMNILKEVFSGIGEDFSGILKTIAEKLGFNFGESFKDAVESSNIDDALDDALEVKTSTFGKLLKGFKKALDDMKKEADKWKNSIGNMIGELGGYFNSMTTNMMNLWTAVLDNQKISNENRIRELEKQNEAVNNSIDNEVKAQEEKNKLTIANATAEAEADIQIKEAQKNQELASLEEQYNSMLISARAYNEKKRQLENDMSNFIKGKNNETANLERSLQAQLTQFAQSADEKKKQSADELLRAKNELGRKEFEANKKQARAQVAINYALGIMNAWAKSWVVGLGATAVLSPIMAMQLDTINKQQYVPALAKGGIADGATLAMIGEAGKEAVIPLEHNTGWMKELAYQLNAVMRKDFVSGVSSGSGYSGLSNVSNNVNNTYNQIINAPKSPSRRELYRDGKNLLALKGV